MSSTHVMQHTVQSTRPGGAVRLTRRGRVVTVLLIVTLLFVAFLLGRSGTSAAATESARRAPLAQTTVQPGESLWSVAKRVAPGHDPRDVVDQISSLNHLDGGVVQAGQQLLLPRVA